MTNEEAQKQIINDLEHLLEAAKSGKLQGVVIAAQIRGEDGETQVAQIIRGSLVLLLSLGQLKQLEVMLTNRYFDSDSERKSLSEALTVTGEAREA